VGKFCANTRGRRILHVLFERRVAARVLGRVVFELLERQSHVGADLGMTSSAAAAAAAAVAEAAAAAAVNSRKCTQRGTRR
jgi:mevalonate pyrophosphate decarboxylase